MALISQSRALIATLRPFNAFQRHSLEFSFLSRGNIRSEKRSVFDGHNIMRYHIKTYLSVNNTTLRIVLYWSSPQRKIIR